jgi:hypothetical protein
MMDFETRCKGMDEELAGLLLEPETASAEVRKHVAECDGCRRELEGLKATMGLMDAWQAPEPSPFFFTRWNARMREERQAAPRGWLARLKASFTYGPRTHMKPLAAMAMTVMLLVGGGAYLGVSHWMQPVNSEDSAVVNDLQMLDNNAQVLDTLEALSTPGDDGD